MSTPLEGQRVAFCGDPDAGLQPGDRGKVLSSAGSASHVMWATGARSGEILLVGNFDLVSSQAAPVSYDSLESGSLVTISVRDTFDGIGATGLLNALNEEGHLDSFSAIAEEAMQAVATRIRQDPSIGEVLSALDPEEGAEFVTLAAAVLLRDAFSQAEE